MGIYEDPEEHYNYMKLATLGIDSCCQEAPEDMDLPCYICKELGDCYFHLFMVGEDPEETEEVIRDLRDTRTKAVEMYLEHLQGRQQFYERSSYPYKNWQGKLWKDVIRKKIELLERIVLDKIEPGSDCN